MTQLPLVTCALALGVAACGAAKTAHHFPMSGESVAAEATAGRTPLRIGGGGAPVTATAAPSSEVRESGEMIVVEGWVRLAVDDVPAALGAIGGHVREHGGRIVDESVSGRAPSFTGTMRVRVPPALVEPLLAWLGERGEVGARRLQGTDVSREYFDQQLAEQNLELTIARLQALLDQEGLAMKDVLDIEKELTRLRGELEQIKGRLRWLADKVALATLEITLTTREEAEFAASAKFRPGPRASALFAVDADRGDRLRVGFGAALHLHRLLTIDVDVFPASGDHGRGLLATAGGAAYSDFLGRGRRRFLNPFLGYRMGYAHLDRSAFVLGAEAGVELFKHEHLLVEASTRALALIHGDGADAALQTTLTINLPF
jgi:hypothetical protein